MSKHGLAMKHVRRWVYLCVLALTGCSTWPGKEITTTKPYADQIGARYSVVVDDLYAYGVYESLDDKTVVSYVTLVPHGSVTGPEFAFRRRIPKGQVVRILSAWQLYPLLTRSVYYVVAVENADLPQGIPVRLQLDRGNEGAGAELSPDVYRHLVN